MACVSSLRIHLDVARQGRFGKAARELGQQSVPFLGGSQVAVSQSSPRVELGTADAVLHCTWRSESLREEELARAASVGCMRAAPRVGFAQASVLE